MTMPQNYLYTPSHNISNNARQAEDMIPSMTYVQLVQNLGRLSELGVLAPRNPITMLVVARIVDRTRIQRSGMTADQLRLALDAYRCGKHNDAVVKALEQAVNTAAVSEELENKSEAAAY
jgi:hypothetical protein